jgi:hypothetical protein
MILEKVQYLNALIYAKYQDFVPYISEADITKARREAYPKRHNPIQGRTYKRADIYNTDNNGERC